MKRNSVAIFLFSLLFTLILSSQDKSAGPIIKDFEKVWAIKSPEFKADTTKTYKAVF